MFDSFLYCSVSIDRESTTCNSLQPVFWFYIGDLSSFAVLFLDKHCECDFQTLFMLQLIVYQWKFKLMPYRENKLENSSSNLFHKCFCIAVHINISWKREGQGAWSLKLVLLSVTSFSMALSLTLIKKKKKKILSLIIFFSHRIN